MFPAWLLLIFPGRTRREATLAALNEECAAFRVSGAELLPWFCSYFLAGQGAKRLWPPSTRNAQHSSSWSAEPLSDFKNHQMLRYDPRLIEGGFDQIQIFRRRAVSQAAACRDLPRKRDQSAGNSPGKTEILKCHRLMCCMKSDNHTFFFYPHGSYGLITDDAFISASTISYILEMMPTCSFSFNP